MIDFAKHIRIFSKNPTDDFVTKRKLAITEVGKEIGKLRLISDLLSIADAIGAASANGGTLQGKARDITVSALQKQSSSFVPETSELQVTCVAMLGALGLLDVPPTKAGGLTTKDVLAAALWSALSYIRNPSAPRFAELLEETARSAQSYARVSAVTSRLRANVPEVRLSKSETLEDFQTSAISQLSAFSLAMRENAVLDREEIDLLWWALSGWSDALDCSFDGLPSGPRSVAAGVDVASRARRIPSDAHRHLALRISGDLLVQLAPAELAGQLTDAMRSALIDSVEHRDAIISSKHVFPLLNLLVEGGPADGDVDARTTSEWASRALLEAGLLKVAYRAAGAP